MVYTDPQPTCTVLFDGTLYSWIQRLFNIYEHVAYTDSQPTCTVPYKNSFLLTHLLQKVMRSPLRAYPSWTLFKSLTYVHTNIRAHKLTIGTRLFSMHRWTIEIKPIRFSSPHSHTYIHRHADHSLISSSYIPIIEGDSNGHSTEFSHKTIKLHYDFIT